ncbi:MAG: FAD-dependent oxidoreductase [Bacteroidota bacterium]
MRLRSLGLLALLFTILSCQQTNHFEADLIVYGGTSAGVVAAVQASRMGNSVILVGPDIHLGGLTAGGLGWTDSGNTEAIGGVAREFYHRIWQHYQQEEAWVWETQEEYGNVGQGTPAMDGDQRTMWIFEPHVAEHIFDTWIAEEGIIVHRNEWLDRSEDGVHKEGAQITTIKMLSGKSYAGKMFIDATYEGDLMAAAGISYTVGREANSQYEETWNGIQVGVLHHRHWFMSDIDPYVMPGHPASGLLPRISPEPPGVKGEGDHRLQAYCYRMCLSNHPDNRLLFPKPAGYDSTQYELLVRVFESGWRESFDKFDPIPNRKTDTNNHGPFSTDNIGMNYDYPEASYERRQEILEEHKTYQQGLMYFLQNDPRVPPEIQEEMNTWGLARDEFTDNDHWPHQIYVREARRMVGTYVMTEHETLGRRGVPQPIGMGSYTLDSHNVQRYVKPDGFVQNEGDIGVKPNEPYRIAFGSILPKREEATNLLVPVALSSSHIAFGSIRMEPVFMILGQSAATTASMAMGAGIGVQEVDYEKLRVRLLEDGQRL